MDFSGGAQVPLWYVLPLIVLFWVSFSLFLRLEIKVVGRFGARVRDE